MLDPQSGSSRTVAGTSLSRRRVLLDGGRGLLALAVVGTAVAACGNSGPPAPDPLEAELQAARQDSELAAAAAKAAPPSAAPALSEIAAQRARHAAALVEELARAAGKPTPTESTVSAAPTAKPGPPPTVGDVRAALKRSAESAAKLAPTLSGYRAGLMGSIAAACTASYTVGLAAATSPGAPPDNAVSHLPEGSANHLPGPGPSVNAPGPTGTAPPSDRQPR